ncbi:MAG TPA: hypothetical protein VLV76_20860 [Candidatus Acidoferrum sp.]|nr:hypothetical protein [Candidatus Acidoferrum sp.]
MTQPIEQLIDIYSPQWPGRTLAVHPGDLRLFAPSGIADLDLRVAGLPPHDSYGNRPADPLRAAPLTEPAGGAVYIQGQPAAADVAGLLRLLRVEAAAADYAAFLARARDPIEDRYLAQLRLIRVPALVAVYQALSPDEMRLFPDQRLTIGEVIPAFIADERQRWDAPPLPQPSTDEPGAPRLQQALAFGFLVENAHYGVYRIWSRVWLVPQ